MTRRCNGDSSFDYKYYLPSVPTRFVDQELSAFADTVEQAKSSTGSIPVATLRAEAKETGSVSQQRAVEVILDHYKCPTAMGMAAGWTLSPSEVQRIERAIGRAVLTAHDVDRDGSGAYEQAEAANAQRFVGSALDGAIAQTVVQTECEVARRQNLDSNIVSIAGAHAETGLGTEAIAWFYRGLIPTWPQSVEGMDDRLTYEERFLPRIWFGTDHRHLSDEDVLRMCARADPQLRKPPRAMRGDLRRSFVQNQLQDFIAHAQVRFEKKHGIEYRMWLNGVDPAKEHVPPPTI